MTLPLPVEVAEIGPNVRAVPLPPLLAEFPPAPPNALPETLMSPPPMALMVREAAPPGAPSRVVMPTLPPVLVAVTETGLEPEPVAVTMVVPFPPGVLMLGWELPLTVPPWPPTPPMEEAMAAIPPPPGLLAFKMLVALPARPVCVLNPVPPAPPTADWLSVSIPAVEPLTTLLRETEAPPPPLNSPKPPEPPVAVAEMETGAAVEEKPEAPTEAVPPSGLGEGLNQPPEPPVALTLMLSAPPPELTAVRKEAALPAMPPDCPKPPPPATVVWVNVRLPAVEPLTALVRDSFSAIASDESISGISAVAALGCGGDSDVGAGGGGALSGGNGRGGGAGKVSRAAVSTGGGCGDVYALVSRSAAAACGGRGSSAVATVSDVVAGDVSAIATDGGIGDGDVAGTAEAVGLR